VNAVAAQFKNEQSAGARRARWSLCSRVLEYGHGFSFRVFSIWTACAGGASEARQIAPNCC